MNLATDNRQQRKRSKTYVDVECDNGTTPKRKKDSRSTVQKSAMSEEELKVIVIYYHPKTP